MNRAYVNVLFTFTIIIFLQKVGHTQLCQNSDEFEGMTLDASWLQYQPHLYSDEVTNGQLIVDINGEQCNNNCPWFHDQSAGFIYKNVYGDFEVIALVQSEEASGTNAGDDIASHTQLGGLMARNMNSSLENYVFNVVGTRFNIPSIETKSTTNDNSGIIEHFGISTTRAELRMTRIGKVFNLYSRGLGTTEWIHRSTFDRQDLPDTVQVGIIAYAFESYPEDLAVKIDYIRFSEILKVNNWLGGNGMWSNPNMWSRNEIPDSTHSVVIDNPQAQSIQILPAENFKCLTLDIHGNLSEFIVDGQLDVKANGCN